MGRKQRDESADITKDTNVNTRYSRLPTRIREEYTRIRNERQTDCTAESTQPTRSTMFLHVCVEGHYF